MLPNVFFWMWWFYMPPLFRIGILFPKSHEYDWAFAQMHVILYMDIVLLGIGIKKPKAKILCCSAAEQKVFSNHYQFVL
jgi:hypothetical protein